MIRRAAFVLLAAVGCGGAVPLMHPAHVLEDGEVTLGGGFSGRVPIDPSALATVERQEDERIIQEAAFSPGIAPWVGGRFGMGSDVEAGLTYSGRAIRVDGRYAIDLGTPTLSLGVGASGLLPKRREEPDIRVGGFGGDVPILLGFRSAGDIYALWLGARGGAEFIEGKHHLPADLIDPTLVLEEDVSGWHSYVGGLLGVRVGFRFIHAVLEVNTAMHFAEATVGGRDMTVRLFEVSPSGALVINF